MKERVFLTGFKNKMYCFPKRDFQGYEISHSYEVGFLDIYLKIFFKAKTIKVHFCFEIELNLAEFLDDILSDFYYGDFDRQIFTYLEDNNIEFDLLEASIRGYIEHAKNLLADEKE